MIEGFGNTLKRCRERAGLTQDELAKKVGLSRSAIWQYESGTISEPKYSVLVAMAEACGVTVEELATSQEGNQGASNSKGAI